MAASSPEPKRTPPHPQGQTGGSSGEDDEPLRGFVPRTVTAKRVNAALVSNQPFGKHLVDISVAYRKLFIYDYRMERRIPSTGSHTLHSIK